MDHDCNSSSDDEADELAVALEACSRQLASLCDELGVDRIDRDDDANELSKSRTGSESCDHRNESSAVAIATECMQTLRALQDIE